VTESADEILRRARAVPPGFVSTYGDLCPAAPRAAGRALSECDDPAVPWQRIVRADGSIAKGERQRRLLEAEGVPFRGTRVDLDRARVPAEALDDLLRDRRVAVAGQE
jgi:methylated-DNA-protein-cysteine methyltransferase related protein